MKRTSKLLAAAALVISSPTLLAVQPDAKTVPWVASNPLIPHDTKSGVSHILKGTSDQQGANFTWTWDFGDGSPVATGTVTSKYVIEATHTYTGVDGTIFTATLTVRDTNTGESDTANYFVAIRAASLEVDVNLAIDKGLWYLHKTQRRDVPVAGRGDWISGGSAASGYYAASAVNVNAFEVNGHLESGDSSNPYVETVARGLKTLFTFLTTHAIVSQTNPRGTFSPDSNGNGYGVVVNQANPYYQGGIFMDAIVASGTPAAVTTTGAAPAGANPGILGRTYKDIVQDMVDEYAWAQYDGGSGIPANPAAGGWRYSANSFPDNSACQWAAIGIIAAERRFGCSTPPLAKTANIDWLVYSQDTTGADSGVFGYTDTSPIWGPYNTTPSGMVQLVWNGIGRGDARWDRSETFIRNNFCNTGGAAAAIRDSYYGLFSFTKSMLLHDSNGDGVSEPITLLGGDLDWYAAQVSAGNPCDGVARTLINDQNVAGYWSGHNYNSQKYPFETAQAIIMLNQTVFDTGEPVAVAQAIPNPGVVGQTITFDGTSSFHQDAARSIVQWDWDLDNNGTFETPGPIVSRSFPAIGNYPVTLRVTDDSSPVKTDTTTVIVIIDTPPIAPTANANGPYNFCPGAKPWFLDGTGSVNPDEGMHEPGQPGDTIIEYAWELDGDNDFDDAFGPNPNVTAYFEGLGTGSYLIQLRVTDRTATSFPSSGMGNLSDTDSAQVYVLSGTDPKCDCVENLAARPKDGKVQLTWTPTGAHHYNIYRGTIAGGPYLKIASTPSAYSTYLDGAVVNGTTYYYVVRPATIAEEELCQSNESSATPAARRTRR
ncbi:MAG: PKD domain-containing protein [Verrucomicrobiales bacterium]|nr:PKD domain-containing protein [Verrucomicrobiales bacterium]